MRKFYYLLMAALFMTTGQIWAQGDIANAEVTAIPPQTYTGAAITPALTVTLAGTPLTLNTDYTVVYTGNDVVGTATATLTGAGTYTGTKVVNFTITPMTIPATGAIAAIPNQTYTGSEIQPPLTVTVGGNTLTTDDYTPSYSNNTDAGSATVTIVGKGNYTGTSTANFTIDPMNISTGTIAPIAPQTYTGQALEPAITVTAGGNTLESPANYTAAYTTNTAVGSGTVTVTGAGNYTGTLTGNFTIQPKDISTASITAIPDQPYTGSAIEPTLTVTENGTPLALNTDYTVGYTMNTNPGTATATITGMGNYTGTKDATFTITPIDISTGTITAIPDQDYTGAPLQPALTVTVGGQTLTADDYTATYTNNTQPGTADVLVTGKGKYGNTLSATFVINPSNFSNVTIATIPNQVYTGVPIEPALSVMNGNTPLTLNTNYTASYSNNTQPGTATVTITGINGYSGTQTTTFRIVGNNLANTTIAPLNPITYTGDAIQPALTVSSGGTALVANRDYSVSYTENTGVGTATATITGMGDWGGSNSTTFTINQADINSATFAPIPDQGYTGSPVIAPVRLTYAGKPLVLNQDYTLSFTNNTEMGTATATVTGMNNFMGSKSTSFNIVSGPVTPNEDIVTMDVQISSSFVSGYPTGLYYVNRGDEFRIDFRYNGDVEDIVVRVDGKQTSFSGYPEDHSYYLTVDGDMDHTIVIGEKVNTVVIPTIQGVTTNPPAGSYKINFGQPFSFSLMLGDQYDQSDVKVFVNGKELPSSDLRSATYYYTIDSVVGNIDIQIMDVTENGATSNATIDEQQVKVYAADGSVYVESAEPVSLQVYSITGQMVAKRGKSTFTTIQLPTGIYMVRVENKTYKVIVRN